MVLRFGHGDVWSVINLFHGVVENNYPPWTVSYLELHKLVSWGSGKWSSALGMVMSGAIIFFHGVLENCRPPWTWSCVERHKLL